jgi:hypothetical protein
MTPEQTPGLNAKAIVAAHQSQIDSLYASLSARLPPNDPEARQKFEAAFAQYRKCYDQLGVTIFLLMPNP